MQGIVLSTTFAVSHNLEENKPSQGRAGSVLDQEYMERDWCLQQVRVDDDGQWHGLLYEQCMERGWCLQQVGSVVDESYMETS